MYPTMIGSSMRYWRMRPDPRLRPLVLCYFLARPPNDETLVSGLRSLKEDDASEAALLLPDGHTEIVFTLDALVDQEDAIAHAGTAREVAERLDRHLIQALRDMPPVDQPVDHLLRHIQSSRGALPILQWVRGRGIDPSHIERRFHSTIGMTPRHHARVIRFEHSYHELSSGTPKRAAPHLDGVSDPSHLNTELRVFVGSAPSARRRATLAAGTSITDHLLFGELTRPAHSAGVDPDGPNR